MTYLPTLLGTLRLIGLSPLGDSPIDPSRNVVQGGPAAAINDIVTVVNARTVIEVGSWEGRSAVMWGRELSARGDDWLLICVDTWLGSVEMWERESGDWSREKLVIADGYPTVFTTFASNVRRAGLGKHTVALPIDSAQGLELLKRHDVVADVIYVDAAHDFVNALRDIRRALALLDSTNPRSLVLCDDYMAQWPGVREAIHVSAREANSRIFVKDAQAALIRESATTIVDELEKRGWSESLLDAEHGDAIRDGGDGDGDGTINRLTRELRDRHETTMRIESKLRATRQELLEVKADRRQLRERLAHRRAKGHDGSHTAATQSRDARQELRQVRSELDALKRSRSWRITAWLRRLNAISRWRRQS